MKQKKAFMQNNISLLFSFLLTILFLLLLFCIGLFFGAFNDKVIKQKINESNYYNETYTVIHKKVEAVVKAAGLPVNVLENAVTLERVYIGGKYYVENVLEGKTPVYKTENLETALRENIDNYLMEHNVTVTEGIKAGMDEITARIVQEYQRGIQFDFIHSISKARKTYTQIITIGLPIVILMAAVIIVFLLRIHKYKHRGLRYITCSVISASVITGIAAIITLGSKIYKVSVQPVYYMSFLQKYFLWDIQIYLCMAGLGGIAAILLLLLTGQMKNNIS